MSAFQNPVHHFFSSAKGSAFLALLLVLVLPSPVSAATPDFEYTQLTNTPSGANPPVLGQISETGQYVLVASPCDLVAGTCPDPTGYYQAYLYDTVASSVVKIAPAGAPSGHTGGVAISDDGSRVVVVSQMNLATPSDTDGTFEFFLWDSVSGISRVTSSSQPVDDTAAAISADGTKIVFSGKGDYDPLGGNSEAADEVFFYDTANGQIEQLTDFSVTSPIPNISLDAGGRWVAFSTAANVPGWSNPESDREVVLIDRNAWVSPTDPSGFVFATQATANCPSPPPSGQGGSCDSRNASVNIDASRIVFESSASLNGGNADGNKELFEVSDCPTTGCTLSQLTSSPGPLATVHDPSMDNAGHFIAFASSLNLDGDSGDTNGNVDIFRRDDRTPSPTIQRVTLTPSVSGDANNKPEISGDGSTIAFRSHGDLVPTSNSDGTLEVFIAVPPNEPPELDSIGPQMVNAGQLLTFEVTASDPNSYDELTLSATNLPAGAIFPEHVSTGNVSGTFSWTPPLCPVDTTPEVTFTVDDGHAAPVSEVVTITVQNAYCPPEIAIAGTNGTDCSGNVCKMYEQSPSAFDPISFTVTSTDPDGVASLGVGTISAGKMVIQPNPASTPGATFTLDPPGPTSLSGTYDWSQISPGIPVSFPKLGKCVTSYPVTFVTQGTDNQMGSHTVMIELVPCGQDNSICSAPAPHPPLVLYAYSSGQVPDTYGLTSWQRNLVGLEKPFTLTGQACDPDNPSETFTYEWRYLNSNPAGIEGGDLDLQNLIGSGQPPASGTSPASVSQNTLLTFDVRATDSTSLTSVPKSVSLKVDPDCVTTVGKLTASCN